MGYILLDIYEPLGFKLPGAETPPLADSVPQINPQSK